MLFCCVLIPWSYDVDVLFAGFKILGVILNVGGVAADDLDM